MCKIHKSTSFYKLSKKIKFMKKNQDFKFKKNLKQVRKTKSFICFNCAIYCVNTKRTVKLILLKMVTSLNFVRPIDFITCMRNLQPPREIRPSKTFHAANGNSIKT